MYAAIEHAIARPKRTPEAAGGPAKPAHEQHAEPDEHDAHRLHRRRVGAEGQNADDEDEHGREAAGERIDDRDLRPPVRGPQQREVDELEERARRDVGPGVGLDLPLQRDHRREDDDRGEKRDGAGGLRIARAGEEQVPERVHEGGAEGEQERRRRAPA